MTAKKDNSVLLQPRPPIVAVVGHVDHGKTTLLDFIRKANIADKEAGGITQSIGAYEIEHPSTSSGQAPKKITFIDTPGHEAFSSMRTHGATIADLAVLVVAATEGVKPQTEEAIKILKDTKTPFIVAVTKMDMPSADVEKVKVGLLSAGVALEGAGGDVSWQAVSGKTGDGVNDLLGLILLVAEVSELTFDPSVHANGFILEAEKDSRRGVIATIILKNGVLRRGDEIVTRNASGKIKILEDFLGKPVKELLPSSPALIGGFESLPKNGDEFWAGEVDIEVVGTIGGEAPGELAGVLEVKSDASDKPKIGTRAILKADSSGSLEALKRVLSAIVEEKQSSVGEITDNDVNFAKSTGSIIVGFRVKVSNAAKTLADAQRVKIITSDIIYKLEEELETLDLSEDKLTKGGTLEVLAIFSSKQSKQTVGGKVIEGKLGQNAPVKIIRGEDEIGKGRIKSLEQGKQEVSEVVSGNECGVVITTETKIEVGDKVKIS